MHWEILDDRQVDLSPWLKKFKNKFHPSYFDDIDYSEPVVFMPGFEVSDDDVKAFLTDAALTGF